MKILRTFAAFALCFGVLAAVQTAARPAFADSSFTFAGGGNGHGVGLSQYGALGMARAGASSDAILTHFYSGTAIQQLAQPGDLRILISHTAATNLVASGTTTLLPNGQWAGTISPQEGVSVSAVGSSIALRRANGTGFDVPSGGYLAVEYQGQPLFVSATNDRYARGVLQITVSSPGTLELIVRRLSMQEYLYGLGEVPSSWPMAALQTQAIAGRTYAKEATERRRADPSRSYDLNGNFDEAYIGYEKEAGALGSQWVAAVDSTVDRTVTYGGNAIQAFYSASDGGYTENSEYVFVSALPYLRAVPDPFDAQPDNKKARWSQTYSGSELGGWVQQSTGTNVGTVTSVRFLGPFGASGRIDRATVVLTGTNGSRSMTGDQFRAMVNQRAGTRQLFSTRLFLNTDPFGSLDGVNSVTNGVIARGWAIDPTTTAPIAVHAYVDGVWANAATADQPRPDVGAAFPGLGANHGYQISVPASSGQHQICVYAINDGAGNNPVLGCSNVLVGAPIGSFDDVRRVPGGLVARGWSIDPDTANPIAVHAYVDGAFGNWAVANLPRPDVGAAYPALGANHGYAISVPVGPGAHRLCMYGINDAGPNPSIGCRDTVVSGDAFGSVDEFGRSAPSIVHVRGWAIDPDTAAPLAIHVYVDGTYIGGLWGGAYTASTFRPDVGAAFAGYGDNHGFDITLLGIPSGHSVCLYAINVGPGATRQLICGVPA